MSCRREGDHRQLSDTRVYEPQIRARLFTTALNFRLKDLVGPVTRVKKKKKKKKKTIVTTGVPRSYETAPPSEDHHRALGIVLL